MLREIDDVIWFCVADGAGGTGGGQFASQAVIDDFRAAINSKDLESLADFEALLRDIDLKISRSQNWGESTAVLGKVENGLVSGASIGDSQAWLFNAQSSFEITHLQYRKPLMGSGKAVPIEFGVFPVQGSLMVGSDGLFNHCHISEVETRLNFETCAEDILSGLPLKKHRLMDDFSVILIQNLKSARKK